MASTFNCNAGRLLFKTKANKYTDSQRQEIVMSKSVTQRKILLYQNRIFVPQLAGGLIRREARRRIGRWQCRATQEKSLILSDATRAVRLPLACRAKIIMFLKPHREACRGISRWLCRASKSFLKKLKRRDAVSFF